MPHPLENRDLRELIQHHLDAEIEHQRTVLAPLKGQVDLMVDAIASLLQGGKRMRAAFLYWGYRLARGPHSEELVRAACSMEMFQAAALLHDDVMDSSDTRRGKPAAHRVLEKMHADSGLAGDSQKFGEAGAILAGDLCLTWADEMFATSGLPADAVARGRTYFDLMRTQLMGGQFLDVLESAQRWEGLSTAERLERALRVVRFKSAKYTIEHPLLIGASCAGAPTATLDALSQYGLALGEAFQLRDDLLGIYGDPAHTGKPAGDDLREGKRTAIIAYLLDTLSGEDAAFFESRFGQVDLTDAEIDRFRELCQTSGAVDATERLITSGAHEAAAALAPLQDSSDSRAYGALLDLITQTTSRNY